jgi:ABC-type Mn2+/Zn2+ transport system permease subunit
MLHALADPWSQDFVRRALLELVLAGIAGGTLGCWVVYYELSYSAESLAHALFPGLVAAALFGVPLLLGGAVGVAVAAGAVAVFGRTPEIGRDTSVAVVVTTLFGLGVVLGLSPSSPPGLNELLFGNVLAVTGADLAVSAGLTAAVLGVLAVLHRKLLVVGFDRGSAAAFGARPLPVDLALLALIAAAVIVGTQALGNLLVVAVVVGPAATARLLTRRLVPMMAVASGIAVVAAVSGLYLSYYADLAAGASVALAIVAGYLLALGWSEVAPRTGR